MYFLALFWHCSVLLLFNIQFTNAVATESRAIGSLDHDGKGLQAPAVPMIVEYNTSGFG